MRHGLEYNVDANSNIVRERTVATLRSTARIRSQLANVVHVQLAITPYHMSLLDVDNVAGVQLTTWIRLSSRVPPCLLI